MQRITSLLLISLCFIGRLFAEDPTQLVQQIEIHINTLGDADCAITQKMTQGQWESFKQSKMYNDPSIARRDMQRSMSAYVLEDFKRDIDEMNRSVTMSCKIKAMAAYKGHGHWELKLDSKDPQITKLTDNSFMSTSNANFNGILAQQIYKIYFPSSAGNIQQSTDSFNKAIFTYNDGGFWRGVLVWNNIVGFLLLLAAGFTFWQAYSQKRLFITPAGITTHGFATAQPEKVTQ